MKLTPLWIILLIASAHVHANPSCESLIKNISDDNHHLDATSVHEWQNISWLQSHLNTAPAIKKDANQQTTYEWVCANTAGNTLTATTNSDGQLIKVQGSTDNDSEEAIFSADITPSPATLATGIPTQLTPGTAAPIAVPAPETDPAATPRPTVVNVSQDPAPSLDEASISEETYKKAADQAIPLFNKWFNTDVTNEMDLQKASQKAALNYFSKLRSCTPGTYKYPVYNIIDVSTPELNGVPQLYYLATATISAPINKLCPVKTTLNLNDRQEQTQCNFSPLTLALYTDEFATLFSTQAEMAYLQHPALAKFIKLECKKILNEDEVAEIVNLRRFIDKFKKCAPGTYYTKRLPATIKTVISGFENDKCMVKATFHLGKENSVVHCAYSQASLDFFAESRTKSLNDETKTSPEKITPEMNNIMETAFKECDSVWQPL